MASVSVVLRKEKTNSKGEHPVFLRITHLRKHKYLSLSSYCSLQLWDEKKQRPKRQHEHFHEMSALTNTRFSECEKIIFELEKEGQPYSLEEIFNRLNFFRKKQQTTVLEYFQETIDKLKNEGRLGYAEVFYSTRNYLRSFRDGKDFFFSDINLQFLTKFDAYLTIRGLKPNAAFVPVRTFKTLLNYAKKEGLAAKEFDPFKDFSFTKYRKDKPIKRAISRDDIRKIDTLSTTEGSMQFHAQKMFMFIFYSAGINFIDLAYLRFENISANRLTYVRRKTKEQIVVNLLEPALEIIKYYKINHPNKAGYVFPILNERHITAESKDNRVTKMLKNVNRCLKELAQLADIQAKVTTYVGRHSFATSLRNAGVPTAIISQALGHESESVTKAYLASFESDVMEEAMRKLL